MTIPTPITCSRASSGLSYHPTSAGPAGVVLLRPASNPEVMAESVELDLKRRITAWREGKGWSTVRRYHKDPVAACFASFRHGIVTDISRPRQQLFFVLVASWIHGLCPPLFLLLNDPRPGTMISATSWGRQSSPMSRNGCAELASAVTTFRMPFKEPFQTGDP